jgi:hypothetical protein
MFKTLKNMYDNSLSFLQNKAREITTVATVSLISASGSAGADTGAVIDAAFTSAQTNVGAAVAGIIALVAVVTGIGLIVKLLSR